MLKLNLMEKILLTIFIIVMLVSLIIFILNKTLEYGIILILSVQAINLFYTLNSNKEEKPLILPSLPKITKTENVKVIKEKKNKKSNYIDVD